MGKRTGKPKGRPPKSDVALILAVGGRPSWQSVEAFCEENVDWLIQFVGRERHSQHADPVDALTARYYRVAREYAGEVFEGTKPGRGTIRLITPWWVRKQKPKKKR